MARITPDRQLVWVSRTGKREVVPAATGLFRFPHLSADGRSVLAESMDRAGAESNIWLIAGTDRKSVTIDPGKEVGPVWSPDGKRFAYEKDDKLWTRDIQGGAPELLSASLPGAPTSWSLDGQKLAVTRHDPVTIRDACVIDLGKPGKPVSCPAATPFIEHYAQISPDGEWLAYRSNESGRTQVYVVSLRAGAAANRVQVSPPDKDASGPRLRRDGKELYFIRETKLVAAPAAA